MIFDNDCQIKIKPNTIFIVNSKDEVTVKTPSKLYKLKGEEVQKNLIPAIEYLYDGISIKEISQKIKDIDINEANKIINTLYRRGWLVNKDNKKKISYETSEENSYKSVGINYDEISEILSNKTIGILGFSNGVSQLASSLVNSKIRNINILIPRHIETEVNLINDIRNDNLMKQFVSTEYFDMLSEEIILDIIQKSDIFILFETMENIVIEEYINKTCIDNNVPWIRGIIKNFSAQIGPLVMPKATPCLKCYNDRIYSNLSYYDENVEIDKYIKQRGFRYYEGDEVTSASIHMGVAILNSQITQFLIKDVTWNFPITFGKVIEFNTFNMQYEVNEFLRIPRCPICSKKSMDGPVVKSWMEPYNYQV